MNDDAILFSEKQKFRQWWLWIGLVFIQVLIFYRMYNKYQRGIYFKLSFSDYLPEIIFLLVILLFMIMKLETQIKKDGIYIRFYPFQWKFSAYKWADISKIYMRNYSPLLEFGGWGIRFGFNGTAYNVAGNEGLQLEFPQHKLMLIGTQKANEMEKVLKSLGQITY